MKSSRLIIPAIAAGLLLPAAPAIIKPTKDWAAHEQTLLGMFLSGITPMWSRPPPSGVVETETIFDSGDKGASLTIGAGTKDITKSGDNWNAGSACATTNARTNGFRYFEIKHDVVANPYGQSVCIVDASVTWASVANTYPGITTFVHAGAESATYIRCYGGDAVPANGTRWWDGTNYANDAAYGAVTTGDYSSYVMDIGNGKLWFGKNNTWGHSSAPALNGSDYHMIDRTPQTSGGYEIMCALYSNADKMTLRTKTSEFQGTIPTGATAWDIGA